MNEDREVRLRKTLRGIVLVLAALTFVAIVFGVMPGHEYYEDGKLVERTTAGGAGFLPFACWLIGPGLVVWLHPKVGVALMWSVLGWLGWLMMFGFWGFEPGGQHVELWPATAVFWLMAPVLFTLLVGMPFGLALYRSIIRHADRRAAELANPPMPAARVVIRHPRA